MKALFLYKYLTLGGCETVIRARIDGLEREGIEAHAWFLRDLGGSEIFSGLSSRVTVGGLHECEPAILAGGFDVVSTIDTEEIFPLFQSGERLPPLVIEAHSPHLENLEYLRALDDVPVAEFFVPSAYQAQLVAERIANRAPIVVVPNPLREPFCREIGDDSKSAPTPLVAWIGRLDDLKNWQEFIEVAGAVRAAGIDAEFRLVGKAPDAATPEALLGRIEAAGIADRFRWYRGLDHARIPPFLDAVRRSGGVVVATSRGESFGMTVAEAMARACACVVADRPPLNELASGGRDAALYAPGDVSAAARRIASLLGDDAGRAELGRRGRETILAGHAPEKAIPVLARVLRGVAAGTRP